MSLRQAGVSLIDCEHRTPPATNDGYPYVGIPQIKNGRVDLDSARPITEEHFRDWTRKANPQPFDIILSRRCNPGDTGFVSPGLGEFAVGQNLVLLRSDGEKIIKPFLRWLSRGPEWWAQVEKYLNAGAVFDSLKCADIPEFRLPIPPLSEQRAIAHILGTLDDKIELNRRMAGTLEATARALFKSWFVDFDPVRAKMNGLDRGLPRQLTDMFSDRTVSSEVGEIPEGWEQRPISDFATIKGGKQLPKTSFVEDGPIPVFGGAGLMGRANEYNASGFVISVGRVGAYCGQFSVHLGKAWINNNASLISPLNGVSGEWLYLALCEIDIDVIKRGAAQPFVANSDIAAAKTIWPGGCLMESFENIVRPMWQRIEANRREMGTLVKIQEHLLPKLVSGAVRGVR